MREIKFRAWRKNLGGMFYLDKHGDMNSNSEQICLMNFLEQCDQEKTIDIEWMQYTGLKDKNGKEIYEGDMFRISETPPEINRVVFEEGCWCLEEHGLYLIDWCERGEVIGNIYENPELIKE